MNNNSGISTLTMGAEVILLCPGSFQQQLYKTNGEQEQSAMQGGEHWVKIEL